ncbi:MAG: hypothetical protein HUU17_01225 [Chthonomonadales bacterium]|nr:hypothetical protein [Chthonomonadales bacterium]
MSPTPRRADLRAQFAKWGLHPKTQGKRPTCSVFAVTAALEFAVAQRHEAGCVLSEEYLNWASNEAIGEFEDGGFFSDLWTGFQKHGICEEPLAPYAEAFDPEWLPSRVARGDGKLRRDAGYELAWIKEWNVTTGLTDDELAAILDTLASGNPVCAGLRWPIKAEYDGTTLRMCGASEVFDGHSVLLVGYNLEPSEGCDGVIVFKDSGSGGRYASMPIEYARAYTNDAAVISD